MWASPALYGSSGKLSAVGFSCVRIAALNPVCGGPGLNAGYSGLPAVGWIHEFQYHGVGSTALAPRNCTTIDVPAGSCDSGGSNSYANDGFTFAGSMLAPLLR